MFRLKSAKRFPSVRHNGQLPLQLDPAPHLPLFDFHLAPTREPCKRAHGLEPRPGGLTLLSKTDITGRGGAG